MVESTDLPVTVKHRIGVDDFDSYDFLCKFVDTVAKSGCSAFLVHARKAWLKGLSPKQNREVPELNYERVYQLKNDFPELEFIINGGISNLDDSLAHLKKIDGVMLGREAYANPYMLSEVDRIIYGDDKPSKTRQKIAEEFVNYIDNELAKGVKLSAMTRHILGLYHGMPGARQFRRHISENAHKPGANTDVVINALKFTSGAKNI
jgi:tRNA-dihydrouridine synthase A